MSSAMPSIIPPPSLSLLVLESLLELFITIMFLKAYNVTRNLFGSQACTPGHALGHAEQVIFLERMLGMFWEQEIQGMVLKHEGWIRFWNVFYGSTHMAVTVFVLVFLFVLKPQAYQRCRTTFIIMNTIALGTYALYPLMPPRLINDCEDQYGGCAAGYTFVDTMAAYRGLWSWKQKGIAQFSNQYAAMPSMHAGYAVWCSLSIYKHSPYALPRLLAVVYPFLTLYCIVVTANHFFLDAVLGALCYYVADKLAARAPKVGRGAGGEVTLLVPSTSVRLEPDAAFALSEDRYVLDEESLLQVTLADLKTVKPVHCSSSSSSSESSSMESRDGVMAAGDVHGLYSTSAFKKR